jgi:hypothetical protein
MRQPVAIRPVHVVKVFEGNGIWGVVSGDVRHKASFLDGAASR